MISKYRKKPVVIEAARFDGTRESIAAICRWANTSQEEDLWIDYLSVKDDEVSDVLVHTLEGPMRVNVGDWIIKGVQGEFYPCKPDIFAATYEEVNDD
ncbi:hypothetical protein [Sinimarinibacterium flocculans]|uniref:hypothetical protein n=1 Tax=Sinimarinibacterium flocculans TaxID=985250 RepID=UPI00248FCFCD|nr:hypothetical protein [Sinimarinibacterium flocculans]